MARRKICRVNLDSSLNSIVNIAKKSLGLEEKLNGPDKATNELYAKVQKHIINRLEDMKDQIKRGTAGREDLNDLVIEQLKGGIKREIIDTLNTIKINVNDIREFDLILGRGRDENSVSGAIKTFFQNKGTVINGQKTWYNNMVDNLFKNLNTAGTVFNPKVAARAFEYYYDAIAGGDALHRALRAHPEVDNPEKEIFMALFQGTSKVDELNYVAKVFKEADRITALRVKEEAPYFNILDNHVVPNRINVDAIRSGNLDEFIEDLTARIDRRQADGSELTDAQIRQSAEELRSEVTNNASFAPSNKYRSTSRLFGHRKWHFKTPEDQWEFLSKWGKFDRGVLTEAFLHRQRLIQSTALYNLYGPDIGFNLHNLKEHILQKYPNMPVGKLNNELDIAATELQIQMGKAMEIDEVMHNVSEAVSNIISYGLTGSSAIRNIAFDQTIYTGLVSHLFTRNPQFQETVKATWELARHMAESGRTDELADLLETQMLPIKFEQATMYKGYMDALQGQTGAGKNPSQMLAKKLQKNTASFRSFVSRWSAADLVNKASRTSQAVNAGKILMDSLGRISELNDRALIGLFNQAGITLEEWTLLRKVPKLEFEGKDLMIDARKIKVLTDADTKGVRSKLESHEDFVQRLKYGYQKIHTELLNHLTTTVSKRGQIEYRSRNPGLNTLVRSALSFSNIGLSQWYNQLRALKLAHSMDPNTTGGRNLSYWQLLGKHPSAFARLLSTNLAGGMMILWAGDLLRGDTPRDISPQVLAEALAASGAGGLISIAYMQMQYNRGNIGTPIRAFIQPLTLSAEAIAEGRAETAKRNLIKAAQVWLPGANMWYTKEIVKQGVRKALDIPDSSAEKRRAKKLGTEDLF